MKMFLFKLYFTFQFYNLQTISRHLYLTTYKIQTANAEGQKPCDIDGKWCDTEDIREEIYIILGERPTADVVKDYNKIA